jgi:cytoskeletal protein CcmA (bactofilin family)
VLKQKVDSPDKVTTIIGPEARVEGTLAAKCSIRVDGSVQGKIITPGEVIIGEGGKVEADVDAGNLVIAGSLTGNVEVKSRLELKQGGTLRGDLRADKVIMEEGAFYEGRCSMSRQEADQDKKGKA